jgi:hypothetical protein
MDIATVLLPLVNEAVRDFGPWAALPTAFGVGVYEVRRKLIAKDEEIAVLRQQIHDLQEKRLADAREMIRVAEASAAATTSRTQSDQRVADLIEALLQNQAGHGLFGRRR